MQLSSSTREKLSILDFEPEHYEVSVCSNDEGKDRLSKTNVRLIFL